MFNKLINRIRVCNNHTLASTETRKRKIVLTKNRKCFEPRIYSTYLTGIWSQNSSSVTWLWRWILLTVLKGQSLQQSFSGLLSPGRSDTIEVLFTELTKARWDHWRAICCLFSCGTYNYNAIHIISISCYTSGIYMTVKVIYSLLLPYLKTTGLVSIETGLLGPIKRIHNYFKNPNSQRQASYCWLSRSEAERFNQGLYRANSAGINREQWL